MRRALHTLPMTPDTLKPKQSPTPDHPVKTPDPALATVEAAAAQSDGIIARLGRWWDRERGVSTAELKSLYTARLTDVAANRLAKQWAQRYQPAEAAARRAMLAALIAAASDIEPRGDHGIKLLRRLNVQSDSLRFMVELRADMLRWRKQIAGIAVLERELESLLGNWFDVGMLELRPISWDSPASLLEKLIQYEAVHEIRSWDELKHRVAENRRCYAFFHPRMSDIPVIFVEVAFAHQMAANVQALLDPNMPAESPAKARWAIFYSISNTQPGLRGISFGNFLLKRVIDELVSELPRLKSFATLSPIPGFSAWLAAQDGPALADMLSEKSDAGSALQGADAGQRLLDQLRKAAVGDGTEALQRDASRLVAQYLTTMKNGQPIDPVARFHLGNGARIERINWAADVSAKGIEQSGGIMVNYLYDLDQLDQNLARLAQGPPSISRKLGRR